LQATLSCAAEQIRDFAYAGALTRYPPLPTIASLPVAKLAGTFQGFFHKRAEENMNFIIWIVIGGIIGWLASMVMRTDAQQGIFLNIVVGIVGAFLGGWLLSPLFGTGTINADDFSLMSLLVSFLGAVILLAIVNLIRRGRAR
jgi:uncharacterized membrane protein YeaQ/YmgE (transglycosylase-associated protein family)